MTDSAKGDLIILALLGSNLILNHVYLASLWNRHASLLFSVFVGPMKVLQDNLLCPKATATR